MKRKLLFLYALLWLMLISFSLLQQTSDVKEYAQSIAIKQAEMFFKHIVLIRKWGSDHGGVYVPVTEKTPVNPYLHQTNRDIELANGQKLTLVNPAYMLRQIAEMEQSQSGISFHLSSLKPIRPENQPDEWEQAALLAFEQGEQNRSGLVGLNGEPYYRYIAPLLVEASCLKCHASQDYKLGDIRGAASVNIPASSIDGFINERITKIKYSHAVVAALGLVVLLLVNIAQAKIKRRLKKARNHLQLAYLDALTSLPNRRYYDAFVRREWKRACRQHYPMSMIMIDIDCFKAYNDNLGHVEGDACLRQVAKTLRHYFRRPGDLIARYGGEEFCVVAACDEAQIAQLAEILRVAVENMRIVHPNSAVSSYVTVSLGMATMRPLEGMDCQQLLLRADQALYSAKQSGRNCVNKYPD